MRRSRHLGHEPMAYETCVVLRFDGKRWQRPLMLVSKAPLFRLPAMRQVLHTFLTCILCTFLWLSGCVSLSAGTRIGPTVDSSGNVDVQGTVVLSAGYSLSDHSSVQAGLSASSGSRSYFELGETIEYVNMDHEKLGYRAGMQVHAPVASGPSSIFVHTGLMRALRQKKNYSSGGKIWGSTSSGSFLMAGFDTRFGFQVSDEKTTEIIVGADLTIDYFVFSRM